MIIKKIKNYLEKRKKDSQEEDLRLKCKFCGSVMETMSCQGDSQTYWKYYLKEMVCDDCFDEKTRGMDDQGVKEFRQELGKIADKEFIKIARERGYIDDTY